MPVIQLNSQVTIYKEESELKNYNYLGNNQNEMFYAKAYQEDIQFLINQQQGQDFGGCIRLLAKLSHTDEKRFKPVICPVVLAFSNSNPGVIYWDTGDYAIVICPPDDRDPASRPTESSVDKTIERMNNVPAAR